MRDQNEKVPIIVYSIYTFALSYIYNLGKFITAIADCRHEFLRERKNNNLTEAKLVTLSIYTLFSCMSEVNNALIVAAVYTAHNVAVVFVKCFSKFTVLMLSNKFKS